MDYRFISFLGPISFQQDGRDWVFYFVTPTKLMRLFGGTDVIFPSLAKEGYRNYCIEMYFLQQVINQARIQTELCERTFNNLYPARKEEITNDCN